MTHVKLMGEMGEKFGTEWNMNVRNFRDMFRLIDCQTEGFKEYLVDCANKGVDFTIQNGKDLVEGSIDVLIAPVKDTVIITPVASGAGLKDALKIIAGVLLIIYGPAFIDKLFFGSGGGTSSVLEGSETITEAKKISSAHAYSRRAIQALGVNLGMSGVTGYLTPESPSESGKSYLYDGPENNVLQGAPVPLLYGRLLIGGSVINFNFIEDQSVAYNTTNNTSTRTDESGPDDDGTSDVKHIVIPA